MTGGGENEKTAKSEGEKNDSSESLRAGVEVLDKVSKKISANLAQSNEKGATANT